MILCLYYKKTMCLGTSCPINKDYTKRCKYFKSLNKFTEGKMPE